MKKLVYWFIALAVAAYWDYIGADNSLLALAVVVYIALFQGDKNETSR